MSHLNLSCINLGWTKLNLSISESNKVFTFCKLQVIKQVPEDIFFFW